MVFEFTDYRIFLKTELARRAARNPKYSLRAMARSFSISPTLLSQIKKGERNLTGENAVRLAQKLGMSKRETEYFCSLVQYQDAKRLESKALLLEKINTLRGRRDVHNISLDAFRIMSDWYHYAIFGLLYLPRFKPTPRNIAAKLGITVLEAELAIERMVRLEILEPTPGGGLKHTKASRIAESKEKNEALQAFHRQMLEKASQSLSVQSPGERHIGSETFAFDAAQTPEAQKRINEFLDDMAKFSEKSVKPTDVYHLGVQFFRLTQKDER